MKNSDLGQPTDWFAQDRFLELHSRWLTVIGEHLRDTQGEIREYWRIEKADSVVILPLLNHQIMLPTPSYRPGVGITTLDFPGGRVPAHQSPRTVVPAILERELGIKTTAITNLKALNHQGWPVNSSFSNQKLYGFVAELQPDTQIPSDRLGATYETTNKGIKALSKALLCLQCRAVLLEWHCSLII